MATKGTNKKQQFSIDILMGEYATWLEKKVSEKSIPKYKAVDVFFERDSFRSDKLTNQERNFMDLLPKLIGKRNINFENDRKKKTDGTNENDGTKKNEGTNGNEIIIEIIAGIRESLFKDKSKPQKTKTESNHQAYANKFFTFITEFCRDKDIIKNWKFPDLSAADSAVLSGKEGELYLPNVLRTKFKSRLRCQDRTSGDKIWLPLRFIGKIYSEAKKSGGINENLFSAWLDTLVNSIYIHYEDPNNKGIVKNIPFEKGVSLLLKKDNLEDNEFQVYLIKTDDENQTQYPVLTPTGKGNQKVYMQVKSISDIAIDHVKSIDSTLRELSDPSKHPDGLKQLKIVSDKYKEIQMEDEPNEKDAVNELLDGELNLEDLKIELESIKNDGKLRLMSSKYNSQKSNGDTFQRIINQGDEYWGILEGNEEITDDNGERVYYYQKLTDFFDSKDSFKVTKTKPDGDVIKLNEVDINII